MNPFNGKKIRSGFHNATNKRWFSAVDIIAAAMGSDYQQARAYWKWLKRRLAKQQSVDIVSLCLQMKMEAADGRLRKTDVVDAEGIIGIISAIPSPKAQAAKLWLKRLARKSGEAAEAVAKAAARTEHRTDCRLYHTTRTVIYDARIHRPHIADTGASWKLVALAPAFHAA